MPLAEYLWYDGPVRQIVHPNNWKKDHSAADIKLIAMLFLISLKRWDHLTVISPS